MTQPHPQQDHEKVWKLTARGDAGMTIEWDTDLAYLRNQKRRYENMGMDCRIEESLCQPDTHTPAAPATEYTIEQIAEIDNRIRKERKAEREQVLNALEEFLNSDDHLSLFKWEVREQIRSLRCGATDEGGERR